MNLKVRNKIKNDKILLLYMKYLRPMLYFFSLYIKEMLILFFRKRICNSNFEYLKSYRNKHNGKRCFIIGTGPSLTKEDYALLSNEITIGVNSLCLWFDDLYKTTYFFISDCCAYKKLREKIPENSFVADHICKYENNSFKIQCFPVSRMNDFFYWQRKYSKDFSVTSYDANTVIVHAMQFAIYAGFKEIYLLGIDCNYSGKQMYAIDHGIRYTDDDRVLADKKMIVDFIELKKFATNEGVEIYNLNSKSNLKMFEYREIKNILSKQR